MNTWVLVAMLAPLFVVVALMRNQGRRAASRAATVEIVCDGFGVRRELADGRTEAVDWSDVAEVEVVTARRGPHGAYGGVVVIGDGHQRGVLVPIDRLESSGVLEALTHLPRFTMPALLDALQVDPPSRTSVWRRPDPDVRSGAGSP